MDEPRDGPKSFSRRKLLAGLGIAASAVFAGAFINHAPKLVENLVNKITGKKNLIRIGFDGVVYAIAPDITVDGTDDHVQMEQALDALPAAGGKIIIYGGDYDFGAIVSRAINNVVIEGSGKATYLANDGGTNLISAGAQTGWIIKDLRTDAGGLGGTWGATSGNIRKNVWIDTTYYNDPSVATDSIWDEEGDVAVGSGANTATKRNLAVQQVLGRLTAGSVKGLSVAELQALIWSVAFDIAMGDKDITGACQITFTEEHANTSSAGAVTIDWATNGNKQKLTLEASTATTVTFTAPSSGVCNLVLKVVQHASGAGTITWPATVKWPDSTAPTLTATGAAVDICTFYWDGTNYHGCANLAFGVPA